jgi:hypothetical protein
MSPSDPRDPDDRNPPAAEPVEDDVQTEILGPDGVIDLGDLASVDDGGSMSIPLANLPDPPSGQSLTSWTEVIRRQRAASETAPKAAEPVVDAPSDNDLRSRMADEPETRPVVNPRSASEIDLGSSPWGTPGSGPTSSSEVGFPVMAPPSDAAGSMRPPMAAEYPPLTEADFAETENVPFAAEAEPVSDSYAGLGDSPPDEPGSERSSILDVLVSDAKDSGARPPSASDILAYGQAPPMPRRPSSHETVPPPPPPSGWLIDEVPGDDQGELIPESRTGTDAVVDLYAEAAHRPPSITDSGSLEISDEAIEEARRRSDLAESSSVDLSSRPGLVESNFDLGLQSAGDIDLGLPANQGDASSSMVYPQGVRENQAALEAEFAERRRQTGGSPEPIRPVRRDEGPSGSGTQYMLRGTVLGFLIASGTALMAYFGGLVPNSSPVTTAAGTTDSSAEVAKLRKDLDATKTELAEAKKGANPAELTAAKQAAADAAKAEQAAKTELATATAAAADAMKAADAAKAEAMTAKKELADATTGLAKVFKDAGLDPAKPAEAIQSLVTAKTTAETKVVEAEKKATDANKLAETAKKSADDALAAANEAKKAQEASATTLTALTERLVKAKFVGEKADGPALVKGVEDALKAASTDATAALRDELAKSREAETKAKTDLTAANTKATDAAKAADTAKAEATKLADLAKAAETKATTEAAKADKLAKDLAAANKGVDEKVAAATKAADEKADKLMKDLAAAGKTADEKVAAAVKAAQEKAATEAATLKADADKAAKLAADAMKAATDARAEAAKVAAEAKTAQEKVAADAAKLKTENARLAQELETVKDIAAAIKSPGAPATTGPALKPDTAKIAARHYGDALGNLYRGRLMEAESGFRKAITFKADDARFHYLLGVVLWSSGHQKDAEEEFKKGHELELAGSPDRRAVSESLERIQGAARQAVNTYRP